MNKQRWSLSLLCAALVAASQPMLALAATPAEARSFSVSAPDPAQHIRGIAQMFRSNDLAGLVSTMLPPSAYQKLRAEYETERNKPIDEAKRAEFAQAVAKLTGPDAVDQLMAEIEPKLAEARPQAAGAVLIGLGALQMAASSTDNDLTPDQRTALQTALPAVQRWASGTDFLSSTSMRQTLTLFADAVRRTGIDSLDELRALSFEQLLAKGGTLFAASKQAASIYGLDINAIVDSLQVQVLERQGDKARVRTTVTVFDAPIWSEHELVLIDGRWYGKNALEHVKIKSSVSVES